MVIPKIPKYRAYALYRLMYFFDEFCKEQGISYWIEGGTALGAVRHGGLIPWDDDIDVHCPLKDYKRLQRMSRQLGEENLVIRYEKGFGNLMKICFLNRSIISDDQPWSFPFIDVFCVHRVRNRNNDYYMYSEKKHLEVLGGKIKTKDIYPLQRIKFGATYVNAPKGVKNYIKETYGPKALYKGYFQGFHSGRYKPGERELIGKTFSIKGVGAAETFFNPRSKSKYNHRAIGSKPRRRRSKSKSTSRKSKSRRRKSKSKSRRRKSKSKSRRRKSKSKSRRRKSKSKSRRRKSKSKSRRRKSKSKSRRRKSKSKSRRRKSKSKSTSRKSKSTSRKSKSRRRKSKPRCSRSMSKSRHRKSKSKSRLMNKH